MRAPRLWGVKQAPSAWPGRAAKILFRRLDISFHRRAGANEVAVSINIVHAVDRRPVFIDPEGAGWKAGSLARIGPVPFADEVFDGVRGVLQRIVLFVHAPFRDGPRLLANGEHRVAARGYIDIVALKYHLITVNSYVLV